MIYSNQLSQKKTKKQVIQQAVALKLYQVSSASPGNHNKTDFWAQHSSDSRGRGWGLRMGSSNKVPGDEVTMGPGEIYSETQQPCAQEHRLCNGVRVPS